MWRTRYSTSNISIRLLFLYIVDLTASAITAGSKNGEKSLGLGYPKLAEIIKLLWVARIRSNILLLSYPSLIKDPIAYIYQTLTRLATLICLSVYALHRTSLELSALGVSFKEVETRGRCMLILYFPIMTWERSSYEREHQNGGKYFLAAWIAQSRHPIRISASLYIPVGSSTASVSLPCVVMSCFD